MERHALLTNLDNLSDEVGRHHDGLYTLAVLLEHMADTGDAVPSPTCFVRGMGALAAMMAAHSADTLNQFSAAYREAERLITTSPQG